MPQMYARAIASFVLAAATGACASTGAVPRPFPMPGAAPAPGTVAGTNPGTDPGTNPGTVSGTPGTASVRRPFDSYALTGTALSLRGIPYRNGGTDPKGFDCSGFTQYVFAQYGISIPREVREQFRVGTTVQADQLVAGDLLFFATTDPGASHVAISLGGDEFVHAPSSTGVVRVEHLGSSYWSPRFLGARRIN
ncbi:MAG TPA: C40 family peptidase [Vicinamibacterales bacterium]|jgi:cell wall-associated NlpC family hydrolase|nr:C40 family peptidase [Vicinamibacterales bacterium]